MARSRRRSAGLMRRPRPNSPQRSALHRGRAPPPRTRRIQDGTARAGVRAVRVPLPARPQSGHRLGPSLLFLDDVMYAFAWLNVKNYDIQSVGDYLMMLRYWDPGRTPFTMDTVLERYGDSVRVLQLRSGLRPAQGRGEGRYADLSLVDGPDQRQRRPDVAGWPLPRDLWQRHGEYRRGHDRDIEGSVSTSPLCLTNSALHAPFRALFPNSPKTNSMHRYRSHTCGALRDSHIGETVRLSGWVHRVRDHGGVLFIDLRDHYGLTQVVADPDSPAFKIAETLRAEWVMRVDGKVRRRPGGTENAELPTGAVEVFASEIEVLSKADELPCRCSAIRNIRRKSGSSIASSICAASGCTTTSSSAGRSSSRSAAACARAASSNSRRRS